MLDSGKCVAATADIAPGKVVFEVRNAGKLPVVFGILQLPTATFQRPRLHFMPCLSGKRLLMTQTFRDFFRSEVISATEGIAVLDVTLVFTDLKGSTALYERIGDLNAYIQVQRHFQHLLDATVRHNGAVTKTIGDAVMAAFSTSADAVRAALEMREAVDQLNRDRPQRDFILKIGVHRGASIAVTLNERLDYFGQTVNIAARVQNLADGDEICITEEVYGAPDVARNHCALPGGQERGGTQGRQQGHVGLSPRPNGTLTHVARRRGLAGSQIIIHSTPGQRSICGVSSLAKLSDPSPVKWLLSK